MASLWRPTSQAAAKAAQISASRLEVRAPFLETPARWPSSFCVPVAAAGAHSAGLRLRVLAPPAATACSDRSRARRLEPQTVVACRGRQRRRRRQRRQCHSDQYRRGSRPARSASMPRRPTPPGIVASSVGGGGGDASSTGLPLGASSAGGTALQAAVAVGGSGRRRRQRRTGHAREFRFCAATTYTNSYRPHCWAQASEAAAATPDMCCPPPRSPPATIRSTPAWRWAGAAAQAGQAAQSGSPMAPG